MMYLVDTFCCFTFRSNNIGLRRSRCDSHSMIWLKVTATVKGELHKTASSCVRWIVFGWTLISMSLWQGSTVHVGRKDGGDKVQNILSDTTYKKMYDHSPHSVSVAYLLALFASVRGCWDVLNTCVSLQVFVQLDELLVTDDGESEWKETARWIKYEEDVEEGSARWGKPHVASLSFHSLLNLRRCLETGVVLLDLDEKDLPGVAYRSVYLQISQSQIYKLSRSGRSF